MAFACKLFDDRVAAAAVYGFENRIFEIRGPQSTPAYEIQSFRNEK